MGSRLPQRPPQAPGELPVISLALAHPLSVRLDRSGAIELEREATGVGDTTRAAIVRVTLPAETVKSLKEALRALDIIEGLPIPRRADEGG